METNKTKLTKKLSTRFKKAGIIAHLEIAKELVKRCGIFVASTYLTEPDDVLIKKAQSIVIQCGDLFPWANCAVNRHLAT